MKKDKDARIFYDTAKKAQVVKQKGERIYFNGRTGKYYLLPSTPRTYSFIAKCNICGKKYTSKSSRRKYCSKKCFRTTKKEYDAKYKEKHLNYEKARKKLISFKHKDKKRRDMINLYGGQCNKCGIKNIRVLQIDHVNNDGNKDRKRNNPQKYYDKIIKGKNSGNYQLLCANCNWIKVYENNQRIREKAKENYLRLRKERFGEKNESRRI